MFPSWRSCSQLCKGHSHLTPYICSQSGFSKITLKEQTLLLDATCLLALEKAIWQCTYQMRSGHLLQSSLALGILLVWLPICLLPPWSHSTGSAVAVGSPCGGCCQTAPSGWDSQQPVLPREQGSAGYRPSTGFHRSPLHQQHRKSVKHSSDFWARSQRSSWRKRPQLWNSPGKHLHEWGWWLLTS